MHTLDRPDALARAFLRESRFNSRRTWLPLSMFAGDMIVAVALFFGVLIISAVFLKVIFGLVLGAFIARLFVIGHDACHGSFTPSRRLNGIVGRLAFLPSLTPFGPWALGHNRIHHAYTNVKGHDYVWAPLSPDEWRAASPFRRSLERFYRTPFGHGLNYALEIWLKHLVAPRDETRQKWLPSYWLDVGLVALFATSLICSVVIMSELSQQSVFVALLCALLLPFAVWNALMGFVIYLHHTDPDIPWVASVDEQMQLATVTAHVAFPRFLNAFFHNIMDHPAHHIDTLIPLYNLTAAEAALVREFPDLIQYRRFTFSKFWKIVTGCKLYDYERRSWLDFEGNATPMALTPRFGQFNKPVDG